MSHIFFKTPSYLFIRAACCEKQQACFVTLNLEPENLTGFVQIEDVLLVWNRSKNGSPLLCSTSSISVSATWAEIRSRTVHHLSLLLCISQPIRNLIGQA